MFLSVKADDIKVIFWRDSNGYPVDCNIYHPKYGYHGYIDNHMEAPVAMFTSTNYKDYKSDQWVHCVHDLQVLCVHPDGIFTNKDGLEVFKIEDSFSNSRIAENESDFSKIYDREFKERKLDDNTCNHQIFRAQIIKHVEKLIELHISNRDFDSSMEIDLLAKAKMFMDYVKSLHDGQAVSVDDIQDQYIEEGNEVRYLLHPNIIHTFWEQFNDKIWRHLEYTTFLSCFDLNNPPTAKIIYERGMQTLFVYFLSKIDNNIGEKVNDKIALVNFGIKNYRQLKDQSKGSSAKRNDKRTIDKWFRLHSNDTSVSVL